MDYRGLILKGRFLLGGIVAETFLQVVAEFVVEAVEYALEGQGDRCQETVRALNLAKLAGGTVRFQEEAVFDVEPRDRDAPAESFGLLDRPDCGPKG